MISIFLVKSMPLFDVLDFLHDDLDMVGLEGEEDLEEDERYAGHDPEFDPDESVEDQKHQQDDGSLECGILVDGIQLAEQIIADAHIDGGIVLERLVQEILLVGIELGDDLGIGRLFGLERDILSDDGDILHFGIEYGCSIRFDLVHAIRHRLGEEIDDTARSIGEILAGEGEFRIVAEDEEAVADGDEDGEHVSACREIACGIPLDLFMR